MNSFRHNQQGFVAIFSVIIIMMVMTLIAIGYASLAQRAQSRTLDNQLSLQAYYAAESGVNDAINYLENEDASYEREECTDTLPTSFGDSVIDSTLGVEYTCMLITNPVDLRYTNTTSAIGTIKSEDGSNFTSITFEWSGTGEPFATASSNFQPAASWGDRVDVLRVDLVPLNNLTRQNLAENSYTFFLYPATGPSSSSSFNAGVPSATNKGQLFETRCIAGAGRWNCTAEVTLGTPGNAFGHRVTGLYKSGFNLGILPEVNGTTRRLVEGQKNIDVTGKANDVLRRIQVRVPLSGGLGDDDEFGLRDAYGLMIGDHICKRYFVGTGFDAIVDISTAGNPALGASCSIN